MKNKQLLFLILIVILTIGAGFIFFRKNASLDFSQTLRITKNSRLQVTTSFYPLYFFSSQIAGDKAGIKNVTPAGAEPHDYEPSAQDIAYIENSKLLILNGGKLEAWGDKIRENLKGKSTKVITVGQGLTNQMLEEGGKKIIDPHVWLDPLLAKKEADAITRGLITIDPVNSLFYKEQEQTLDKQLDQLDKEYRDGLKNCNQKDFITSHAAFGYLAAHYGLNQVAIAGLSPDEEPSSQELAKVAKFAKDHNVKYIFFESLVSPKLSETIAREVGAKTLVLDPIEGVSDNDLRQGKNYLTIMKENLGNLRTVLECK